MSKYGLIVSIFVFVLGLLCLRYVYSRVLVDRTFAAARDLVQYVDKNKQLPLDEKEFCDWANKNLDGQYDPVGLNRYLVFNWKTKIMPDKLVVLVHPAIRDIEDEVNGYLKAWMPRQYVIVSAGMPVDSRAGGVRP